MAFDFPTAPSTGTIYAPPGGPAYVWDGQKWAFVDKSALFAPRTAEPHNFVVNPAIQITQELAFGTAVTTTGGYPADQWTAQFSGPTGATHINFSANGPDWPADFGQIGIISANTPYTSVAAGNYATLQQVIEGSMATRLNWGRAVAIPAVLAFDGYASLAGTYAAMLRSGALDRSIAFPWTIAAGEESTWKRFTFPVPAITSGTFARNTTAGLIVGFTGMCGATYLSPVAGEWQNANYLGLAGMSNVLSVASKGFYVRRIGLYADPYSTGIAPEFEVPDFGDEWRRCQRYFQPLLQLVVDTGTLSQSTTFFAAMRTTPAVTGGGAGFASTILYPTHGQFYQTTRAYQSLILKARM